MAKPDRSVKNVGMDLTYPPEAETFRTEIRHCEIHKIASNSSNAYAILPLHTSNALIEDNYFHDLPNVMPMMSDTRAP